VTGEPTPLIAITTRRLSAAVVPEYPTNLHELTIDCVVSNYGKAIASAGGIPVLVSRSAPSGELLQRIDGLVLSGGEDVTPSLYGSQPDAHAMSHDRERDDFEIELAQRATEMGLPVLAICRGIQILNVACGGTLVPHLPEVGGFSHAMGPEAPHVRRHRVRIDPTSALSRALGGSGVRDDEIAVNSFHHQAVATPGKSLRAVAWAHDGTIEGVEGIVGDEGCDESVLGVQWHPELHEGVDPLLKWLVASASNHLVQSRRSHSLAHHT